MIGNPLKIEDIISELSRGGIRIPEIQREYVWKRTQIAKLLDSIYQEFPAGSILLWDTGNGIIMRDLSTNLGQNVRPDFVPKVVLDGQQRITSLARVFDNSTGKDERMLFNVVDEIFEPHSPRNAADPRWIDVTELLTNKVTELDILDRLVDASVIDGNDRASKNEIHEHLKKLDAITKYQFPVEIVRSNDLEKVTEVFIRVNSGGTRLRQAELALARLAWKLPGSIVGPFEQMENECVERGFDLDTRFLMRSLIAVATRQSRFRDLKAFWERAADEIESAWRRTENGLRLALDFVEGNIGIPGTEFLPSQYSLIPLVTILGKRERLAVTEEQSLKRWFLRANAFSHYVGSSETILDQDLALLGENCENVVGLLGKLEHDQRGSSKISSQDLERASTSSPFFPLAFLAVVRNDATDWFKGIRLRRDSFADDQNIEYHHIFPRKLLNARGVDRYHRDEIANIAFLGQKANRKILSSKPADYLAEIAETAPERLEAQYVPMDRELWELERYDDFVKARRELLAHAMNQVLEG